MPSATGPATRPIRCTMARPVWDLLGLVQENQQVTPTGGVTLNGTPFQILGDFTITSGTLTVVLSDSANGTVVADAMLVQPRGDADGGPELDGRQPYRPDHAGGGIVVHAEPDLHHQRSYRAKLLCDFLLRLDELDFQRQCRSFRNGDDLGGGLAVGHVQRHQPELPIRNGRHVLPVRRAQRHFCLRRDQRRQQPHGGNNLARDGERRGYRQ